MIAEALRYADDPNAPRVEGEARGGRGASGGGRRVVGAATSPDPDDRRVVHDPVRRGGWSADRARASCSAATRSSARLARSWSTTRSSTCPTRRTSASTTPSSTAASSPTSARSSSCSAPRRSSSWSRRWPATSPTRSPTGPASRPGFVMGALADRPRRLRPPAERLPRRHHRRCPGRLPGAVDLALEGRAWARGLMPVLRDPAAGHPDRRLRHDRRARPPAGRR